MKRSLRAARKIRFTALIFSAAGGVYGSPILITNPSFEAVALTHGSTSHSIAGWTQSGNSSTFHPTPAQFPSGVPDGFNVAAVDKGASISQILRDTLTANAAYTLLLSVGQLADLSLTGYLISRKAGGNLLTSDSSPLPAPGKIPFLVTRFRLPWQTSGVSQAGFDNVVLSAMAIPTSGGAGE
jgi:hypothetical protein